jgi:hypothetical protein
MTAARWLPFVAAVGWLACGNPEAAHVGPTSATSPTLPPGAPIRAPTGAGGSVATSGAGTGGSRSPPSASGEAGEGGGAGRGGAGEGADVDAAPAAAPGDAAARDLASPPADGGAGGASVPPPVDAAPEVPAAVPYATMGWVVTASITATGPNDVAANAIDGSLATRWSTGQAQVGNESFSVDLGAPLSMSQVMLDDSSHPGDFPAAYTLALSRDGVAYDTVATGAGAIVTTIRFTPRVARFVRLLQTGTTPLSWLSIDELTIWP